MMYGIRPNIEDTMEDKIEVLPGGWLKLISVMGDDLSIVNAARQSYNVEHTSMSEQDIGLINYLIREKHGTPTEMVEFKFQVQVPLPVAREWQRHRIAEYNEMSARYSKMDLGFYEIPPALMRQQKGKPGDYQYEPLTDTNIQKLISGIMHTAYERAYEDYEQLLDFGLAKGQARLVLSQGMYTKFTCKMNARSLMNFISLRNNDKALGEIQRYAKVIEDIFKEHCPYTHKAFVKNGRIAP